jgi:DNA polymerase-4
MVQMTEKIAYELRQQNKLTGCVSLKIRYSNFDTITKQVRISYTALDDVLIETVKTLFTKLYDRRLLVRLLGVRFMHLVPGNYQICLFDDRDDMIRLYQEMDKLNGRFGKYMVMRASGFLK